MTHRASVAAPRRSTCHGVTAAPAGEGDSARGVVAKVLLGGLLAAAAPLAGGLLAAAAPLPGPQGLPGPSALRGGRRLLGFTYVGSSSGPRFSTTYDFGARCTDSPPPLPRVFYLGSDFLDALPEVLQPIVSGRTWRDPCAPVTTSPPAAPLQIPYTFDDPALDYQPYDPDLSATLGNLTPLSTVMRPRARAALAATEEVANIKFVEVPQGDNSSVIMRFRGDASRTNEAAAYAYSGVLSGNVIGVVDGNLDFSGDDSIERTLRHEILHTLGLCHPFSGCSADRTLPIGAWEDADQSTILSYNTSCLGRANPVAFGALDLDALRLTYGRPPQATAGSVLTLNGQLNRTSLLPAPEVTTLRARTLFSVVLSLASDSSSATRVGADAMLLAPSARLTAGDLRGSGGGYLIGHPGATQLWGSRYDDIIDPAGGDALITLGGGRNVVVVRADGAQLRLTDFVPGRDRLALVAVGAPQESPAAARPGVGGVGHTLGFAGGGRVTLEAAAGGNFLFARDTFGYDPVPDLSWCANLDAIFPLDLGPGTDIGPSPAAAPGPDAVAPSGFTTPPPPFRSQRGTGGGSNLSAGGPVVAGVTIGAVLAAAGVGVYCWRRRGRQPEVDQTPGAQAPQGAV